MLKNYFLTTIRTLRQNPLYTALSVFGIALTFVFVSVLLLIVETSKPNFIPPKFAERTWQLRFVANETGRNESFGKELGESWVSKMTTTESIILTATIGQSFIVNDQSMFLSVLGVSENYFETIHFKYLRGRPINRLEIAEAIPVVVLDRNTANIYFGKNNDPIGQSIELNATQFRVVGVVENVPLFSIDNGVGFANMWVPYKSMEFTRVQLLFTAKDKASIAETQAELTRILEETNTAGNTQFRIPDFEKQSLAKRSNAMFPGLSIALVCLILMLIPALNILSLNVSKSLDRSEEIAIRKAFGAPKSTIFAQLFFENFLITLVGAIIGIAVTPMLMQAIENMMFKFLIIPITLSLHFDWKTVLLVAGPCVLAFSFLSGSIPAWTITKREITTVLKGDLPLVLNHRRSIAWIVVEQALVFGVLLLCFTSLVNVVTQQLSKGTISTDNIIQVEVLTLEGHDSVDEEHETLFRNMLERVKEWHTVEFISINRDGAIPKAGAWRGDSINYRGNRYRVGIKYCDENFYKVFSPKLIEGEWFRDNDLSEMPPVLVTQQLADNMGIVGSAIGQNIDYRGRTFRITGVVEAFKDAAGYEQLPALFIPVVISHDDEGRYWEYVVKHKKGLGRDFSKAFITEFQKAFPKDQFQILIVDLSKWTVQHNFLDFTLKFYMFGIPTMFLLIFAFLGTFGIVWVQSKKRMTEFGIRLAFGCTPARLQRKLIFENLIITSIAMLPGLIVMANVYVFKTKGWDWLAAIVAAVVLMWVFSAVSAWYPAWKASRVPPVEALKSSG